MSVACASGLPFRGTQQVRQPRLHNALWLCWRCVCCKMNFAAKQRSLVDSVSYPGLKCSGQVCVGSGCTDCTILPGHQGADQVVVCGPGGRYPGRSTGGVALADSGRGQGALDTWALQSARQRPEGPCGWAALRRGCSGRGGWQRVTGLGALGSVSIISFVLQ